MSEQEEVFQPMRCSRCPSLILVSGDWIDPELYVCPACRREPGETNRFGQQLALVPDELSDQPHYDPAMAAIRF